MALLFFTSYGFLSLNFYCFNMDFDMLFVSFASYILLKF
jgi:hypothetical protein